MNKNRIYHFIKMTLMVLVAVFALSVTEARSDTITCGTTQCDLETSKCIDIFQTQSTSDSFNTNYAHTYKCIAKSEPVDCLKLSGWNALSAIGGMSPPSCKETTENSTDSFKNQYQVNADARKAKQNEVCGTLSERREEYQGKSLGCLLCPLFEVILQTDQAMATNSFSALAAGFRNIIIVVLGLFIAYQTLITVSAVTKQDVSKYLGSILVQSFKVLVAALLLSNATYIYGWVICPLMQAGLEFGLSFIGTNFSVDAGNGAQTINPSEFLSSMPKGNISTTLLAQVMATVKAFNLAAINLPTIGGALMCTATHAAADGILPDFSMLIEGALCFVFGWMIALSCCFYLLDSVIRFGIFCALLPFLIASWPFKVTFRYTKAGWDIFMNAFFNFVMMGLVISMCVQLLLNAMTGGDSGNLESMLDNINEDNIKALKELMDLSGTKFLVLLASCIFAFKLVGQVNELANKISGTSGGSGIGNKIGGLAANAAKKVGGTALKGVATVTGASGLAQGVSDKFGAMNDRIRSAVGGGSRSNVNGSVGPRGSTGGSGGSTGGTGGSTGGSSSTGGSTGGTGGSTGGSSGSTGGSTGGTGGSTGGNSGSTGGTGGSSGSTGGTGGNPGSGGSNL